MNAKLEEKGRSSINISSFPFNRLDILERWVKAVHRKDWKPSKSSKLCSEHFLSSDFLVRPGSTKKVLKPDAIPSIFSFPKGLVKKGVSSKGIIRKELDNEPIDINQGEETILASNSSHTSASSTHVEIIVIKKEMDNETLDINHREETLLASSSTPDSPSSTNVERIIIKEELDSNSIDINHREETLLASSSTPASPSAINVERMIIKGEMHDQSVYVNHREETLSSLTPASQQSSTNIERIIIKTEIYKAPMDINYQEETLLSSTSTPASASSTNVHRGTQCSIKKWSNKVYAKLRRKVKTLKQKLRRRDIQIKRLKDIIREIKTSLPLGIVPLKKNYAELKNNG
ncbi:THAP domain-containing protein 5-like isoform X2 [Cylas formicarius]|uniref:THAP domain-containing protein 5-like isoform X2 n=1 Tax=Cylas formicarius TaxID=197179 RepID=UPI0029586F24|nr:THAP domain-containing protein 5-like isoform X2 [Cylas formicarius]